jgi:hypothetical protein
MLIVIVSHGMFEVAVRRACSICAVHLAFDTAKWENGSWTRNFGRDDVKVHRQEDCSV